MVWIAMMAIVVHVGYEAIRAQIERVGMTVAKRTAADGVMVAAVVATLNNVMVRMVVMRV